MDPLFNVKERGRRIMNTMDPSEEVANNNEAPAAADAFVVMSTKAESTTTPSPQPVKTEEPSSPGDDDDAEQEETQSEERSSGGQRSSGATSITNTDAEQSSCAGKSSPAPSNSGPEEDDAAEERRSREKEPTFAQQLHEILENEAKENGATVNGEKIIEWLPAGDAFIIRDKAALEREVLPKYFTSKCKYMSFVRKLYRWGFRQVEKTVPGIVIFMHANFVRGDKQRCVMMRSVVKKSASPHRSAALNAFVGIPTNNNMNMLQAGMFGGIDPNILMQALANQLGQQGATGAGQMNNMFNQGGGPALDQGGGNNLLNSVGLGGAAASAAMSSQLPQGSSMQGMTSADMFEAARRLQRMEQQRQMQGMGINNPSSNGMLNANNGNAMMSAASSQSQEPIAMALNNNNATTISGSSNTGGGMSPPLSPEGMMNVQLASEIMKKDPTIEPLRALELAKLAKGLHQNKNQGTMG